MPSFMTPKQFVDYVGDPKVAKEFATEVIKLADENHTEPTEEKEPATEEKPAKAKKKSDK